MLTFSDTDNEPMTSASPPPNDQPEAVSSIAWSKRILLSLLSLLLIVSVAIEMIGFKSTATAFPFSACFIICLFCLFHSLFWFLICIYKIYIVHTYNPSILTLHPSARRKYIILGILRSLSISVIFVTISRDIPGSLLLILLQFPTPLSIIISRFISSISNNIKPLSFGHWTAIILIFIGVIFGFISSFFGNLGTNYIDYKHEHNDNINAWWYTPIAIVACVPQAMSILYLEINVNNNNNDAMCITNACVSLVQCLFTFLLSPILIYLSDPQILFANDWYLFFKNAFLCLFSSNTESDASLYCPNGTLQTSIQFVSWLFASISVLLLTNYINVNISPLLSRFCILFGLLFAFSGFQTGFPSFVIADGSDAFDECLLLGILCSFVGSIMLLIDFNPTRPNTLLDSESIQFDEFSSSKRKTIKSQLLTLKKQHDAINVNMEFGAETETNTNDYVFYLLMQQQKEIIQEEYQIKLKEYEEAEKQRSQSFHSEFYNYAQNTSTTTCMKTSKTKKKKRKKKKKKKKYYMDEQQMKEYYKLIQQQNII